MYKPLVVCVCNFLCTFHFVCSSWWSSGKPWEYLLKGRIYSVWCNPNSFSLPIWSKLGL